MRTIFALATALLLVGTVLATVPAPSAELASPAPNSPTLEWVRTRHGWQRPVDWVPPAQRPATVDPWVAASFIGLASVLALVAAPPAAPPKG